MNTDLDHLTHSLDDLSVKKQLPRRQQTQKPILKYNTEISKPVQLSNHNDATSVQQDSQQSPVSINGDPTPAADPIYRRGVSPGRHVYSIKSSPNSTKPNTVLTPMKPGSSNPYSRPLSAKDVQTVHTHSRIKKSPSTSMMNNLPNGGIVREAHISVTEQAAPIQHNTFMRPSSAVHRESHLQRVQSAKKFRCKIADAQKVEPISTGDEPAVSGKNSFREKLDKKSITYKAALSQATSEIKVQPKPPTSPQKHSRPPSNKTPTSFETLSRVRNLNYTPTKPYDEVSNLYSHSLNPAAILEYTSTRPNNSTSGQNFGSTNSLHNIPINKTRSLTATTTLNTEINSHTLIKQPLNSGTVYYKKGSKAEERIHEQRPKAEGSLCFTKEKRMEKPNIDEDIDEMEEDDESEDYTPSGERLPGDGEASCEDDDLDDEDDGIDGLDDDCVESDEEGESDGYSITSSLSRQSVPTRTISTVKVRRPSTAVSTRSVKTDAKVKPYSSTSDTTVQSGLRPSLFPNIPPTINFIAENEKVEQLPWEIRKLLKWRMSPITPNIVKSALARVGFRISKKNHDWLGCFGKHMKSQGFKAIKEYQKLNHFPGTFQIGRKDRLWRNLARMQVHFGKREFGFFPQTYVLPQDLKLLKRAWEDGGNKQKWIIKPPASARGIGIKVIHKWNQIPRRRPVIVQRYLSRPYLINDSKFDMRIYVYVSCYDPLRIYIYEDGLARFASCKYSSSMKSLNNKYMHLTNYSINKRNSDYQSNTDDSVCQGHKWSLKSLWSYMKKQGINTTAIWDTIKDLVIKTIICADSSINSMIKSNVKSRYSVHELFGFDVMLDEALKPWIIEVNISPSLHSNSQLDVNIKGQMIKDLFNIAGFLVPDKQDVAYSSSSTQITDFSSHVPSTNYCMDKRLFTSIFSSDERAKHAYYCQRSQDEQALQTVLDIITPDDMRMLTSSIDEDSRKGGFQRVFPTPTTHKYLRLFEQPRYYNLLLDQYIKRFNRMEQKGIALLSSFCEDDEHLQNPSENPIHQWNPPNATTLTYRDHRLFSAPLNKPNKLEANTKQSASTSQLPKMHKKIPRVTPLRCLSQSPSTSSLPSSHPSPSIASSRYPINGAR
ncbi:tubulin monoglutamylase TTLL4 [Patella vulgata]|uniref:tubulin monoglutamylase TTLL4 n=1 Tax=Patella vulgata TaxID=6465 RepID=UPI0024A900FF|nr:tubulin monoglutamylase TTLL4 [Patella vulgata]